MVEDKELVYRGFEPVFQTSILKVKTTYMHIVSPHLQCAKAVQSPANKLSAWFPKPSDSPFPISPSPSLYFSPFVRVMLSEVGSGSGTSG